MIFSYQKTAEYLFDKEQSRQIVDVAEHFDDEMNIGIFHPLSYDELIKEEKEFVRSVSQSRGVYKYGDLIVLSLGERNENGTLRFVEQEVLPHEIRIYVDIEKSPSVDAENLPVFIGKMSSPPIMNIAFYDFDTKMLIY